MKKIWIISLLSVFYSGCSTNKSAVIADPVPVIPNIILVDYQKLIKSESDFIISHQLDDGAFIMSSQKELNGFKINPYFNNLGARALLEDSNSINISSVKKWIVWYMDHLNNDGSVFDYYASSNKGSATLTSTNDFDSIDSYAATFFSLLRRLCEISPDNKQWLQAYSDSLLKIEKALMKVMDNDGLTIAKPSYPVKYTMDNAEVQEGLNDLVWLSQQITGIGDPNSWQQVQSENALAIENDLWNSKSVNYFIAKGDTANWKLFYPGATCQLYPIWCGLISPDSDRAKNLWKIFNAYYPDWPSGKIYDAGGYPWTLLCYVAAIMKDKQATDKYLHHVQSFTDQDKQPTENWYNLEAAFVILAAKKISKG